MDFDLQYLLNTVLSFGLNLAGVIVLLLAAWFVSRWVRRGVTRSLQRASFDATLTKFFSNVSGWLILLLALLAALGIFGVQTTSFAAVIGAAGLAIGLAFQGALSNFAAGVMLLTFRPFKVGDAVKVAGETGKIDEIDLFVTKMDTFDNRRIVIPNGKIFGDTIETITFHPTRRVDLVVGVEYGADLDLTRTTLERAVADVAERLTDPPHQILLDSLGDSSVNWAVRVWSNTPEFILVKEKLTDAVKRRLDEAGIGIPFPQMDVHLDGGLA